MTIIKPTCMFDLVNQNNTLVGKWGMQMKLFNRMNWVIEGMDEQVQPVYAADVALAVVNALKMEESIGQTYELGGPHIYNYNEIYEMFFNHSMVKPYSVVVSLEDAYEMKNQNRFLSFYRNFFKHWLGPDFMTHEAQRLICHPEAKGFKDLYIKPISFGTKVHEHVGEIYWFLNHNETTKREAANG